MEDEPRIAFTAFDRYVKEHGPRGGLSGGLRAWFAEITGGPVPRFEKVEWEEPADTGCLGGQQPRP